MTDTKSYRRTDMMVKVQRTPFTRQRQDNFFKTLWVPPRQATTQFPHRLPDYNILVGWRDLCAINMGKAGHKLSITTKAVISSSTKFYSTVLRVCNGDEILLERVCNQLLLGIRTNRHNLREFPWRKFLGFEIMILPKWNSRTTTTNMIIYGQHHTSHRLA